MRGSQLRVCSSLKNFLTQLSQSDVRSRNVLKCLGYCIKQIADFAVVLYSDNVQRTSKRGAMRTSVTQF